VAICASVLRAAQPGFSTLLGGAGQEYASAVASDAAGNTYVAGLTYSPDFPVTAGALQTRFGGACDAFAAKLGPDGKVLWSTFLGGLLDDWATGIAVDGAGNVLVTGWTRSPDFPLSHPLQGTLNNGASLTNYDAFVAKLDPTGSKLLYSTFLGGPEWDGANGLALDAAGNAYVTGTVQVAAGFPGFPSSATGFGIFVGKLDPQGALVYSFFHPSGFAAAIAVDAAGSAYIAGTANSPNYDLLPQGTGQALVFKLSPDGSRQLYQTTFGGSVRADGLAIAVDRNGAAYVGGSTTSVDFPLVRPIQSTLGARPLWKSIDGGLTWAPLDDLPFAFPQTVVVDPTNAATLYATASDTGVFKSTDAGATWSQAGHGIAGTNLQSLAIDPLHPRTLYAATGAGVTPGVVYKTADGGGNWIAVDSAASAAPLQLAVDALEPNSVYSVWSDGTTRKSVDSGATWSSLVFPGTYITALAIDPQAGGNLFAYSAEVPQSKYSVTPAYLWHSSDGGTTWVQTSSPSPTPGARMAVDASTSPSIVYNGLSSRSVDGGITWTPLAPSPVSTWSIDSLGVDRVGTLYGWVYLNGMFVSRDHGQTWTPSGSPVPPSTLDGADANVLAIVPTANPATLYAIVQNMETSGFLTKLSADGSSIVYSTYLRGHVSLLPVASSIAKPLVFGCQNWISAIVLDAAGNVTVAGGTRAADFPLVNPGQHSNGGRADAFFATIAADGGKLTYSSYVGGSQDDAALAAALDAQGNLILAGQTWSTDFPGPNGPQAIAGSFGDAFVMRVAPPASLAPPVIAAVLNAASYQPGIEAGSWVMIEGANLANTNPGRTWHSADFTGPGLPTSLDGVSVTIDGKPAFVEYISPAQINVQAPSDTALGTVSVVVNNNGEASAPATAQLQATAPAFFLYYGTSNATASRLPDYAPLGDPASTPGTVAAKPGDLIVLWGTGFGSTSPPVTAGTVVTGAPAAVTAPTVTVGGVSVPVLSTVLTVGSAGLYQVTIQLPASLPNGALAVQASVGTVQTPAGVFLIVSKP
jgi:uncharacterized protein (TIGR03437 family)